MGCDSSSLSTWTCFLWVPQSVFSEEPILSDQHLSQVTHRSSIRISQLHSAPPQPSPRTLVSSFSPRAAGSRAAFLQGPLVLEQPTYQCQASQCLGEDTTRWFSRLQPAVLPLTHPVITAAVYDSARVQTAQKPNPLLHRLASQLFIWIVLLTKWEQSVRRGWELKSELKSEEPVLDACAAWL